MLLVLVILRQKTATSGSKTRLCNKRLTANLEDEACASGGETRDFFTIHDTVSRGVTRVTVSINNAVLIVSDALCPE